MDISNQANHNCKLIREQVKETKEMLQSSQADKQQVNKILLDLTGKFSKQKIDSKSEFKAMESTIHNLKEQAEKAVDESITRLRSSVSERMKYIHSDLKEEVTSFKADIIDGQYGVKSDFMIRDAVEKGMPTL